MTSLFVKCAVLFFCGLVLSTPFTKAGEVGFADFKSALQKVETGKLVVTQEVSHLTPWECRVLRNAVFARHGRSFASGQLGGFFNSRPFYEPDPSYSDALLTNNDRINAALISSHERNAKRPLPDSASNALRVFVDALAAGDIRGIFELIHPQKGVLIEGRDINQRSKIIHSSKMTRAQAADYRMLWLDDGDNGAAYSFRMSVLWSYPYEYGQTKPGTFEDKECYQTLEFAQVDGKWFIVRIVDTSP